MSGHERPQARSETWLVYLLFALSGAAGLIYQVVWVKTLGNVLGASAHAVTIILASFMLGLGIGSWLLGRLCNKLSTSHLARLYIYIELGIGGFALLLPAIVRLLEHTITFSPTEIGLHSNYIITLGGSFCVFVFPTVLMGASLPVLTRYMVLRRATIELTVSRLYCVNTIGAIAGTLGSAYFLLPLFGNTNSNYVAVAINFAVAGLFFLYNRKRQLSPEFAPPETSKTDMKGWQRVILVAMCLSGFSAMIYEVAWTRTLSMILGTTTYAFATMLATFLIGIAGGSWIYSHLQRRMRSDNIFWVFQLVLASTVVMSIPLFQLMPFAFLTIFEKIPHSWVSVQLVRFLLAACVMMVPTLCLGITFPAAASLLTEDVGCVARRLGTAYAWNTLGSVGGTLLAGFVLVPAIGLQKTIVSGAYVNFITAGIVLLIVSTRIGRLRFAVLSVAAAFFITVSLVIAPWSPKVMSSGVYVYAQKYKDMLEKFDGMDNQIEATPWQLWNMSMHQYDLLYYKTGSLATVSVMQREDGVRFLSVDGKTDASTNYAHDMKTQVLLGQLPMLYHDRPDNVFVVGLGSGVTVGSILTHNAVRVDCAEFSQSVVEAAEYFSDANHSALNNHRLNLIPYDARNILKQSSRTYDVIVSQPSNPWISGQSRLFTQEWYEIARNRLRPGGIYAQWVPAYHVSGRDLRVILKTLRSVFGQVTAWTSGAEGELIFLARKGQPFNFSYDKFLTKIEDSSVERDISRLGYKPSLLPFTTFAMNENQVRQFIGEASGIPLNTDDHLITEYSTPMNVYNENVVDDFEQITDIQGNAAGLTEIILDLSVDRLKQLHTLATNGPLADRQKNENILGT